MRGGILSISQTHSEVFLVFGVFLDVPGCSRVPCSGVPEYSICLKYLPDVQFRRLEEILKYALYELPPLARHTFLCKSHNCFIFLFLRT